MSEAAKHTPGPWYATTRRGSWDWLVAQSERIEICQMFHDGTDLNETGEANARLIAAAPDMLAALKDALELAKLAETLTGCRADDDYVWGLRNKFAALISRAEPTLPADRKE